MSKQETIKYLTDLMATIQAAYFKGKCEDVFGQVGGLTVHESGDPDSCAISIDLYNFDGDGKPVCDGLKPCTLTFDDGSTDTGWLFCMHYDPYEEETPLVFLFTPEEDGDYDVDPEDVPEELLQDIIKWIEGLFAPNQEEWPEPKKLVAIMNRWADFCYNHPPYDEVILWMVGGSKNHYLYEHFCAKWNHICENICGDDTMATWIRFYKELDDEWSERLMQYVYNEWKKDV